MNQSKKVVLLVLLAAVLLAALVWVKKVVDQRKTSESVESLAEEISLPNQQMAVETVSFNPPAVESKIVPRGVLSSSSNSMTTSFGQDQPVSGESVLPFIQFLALPESGSFGSPEMDWRNYRVYRRAFAKSPESVDN